MSKELRVVNEGLAHDDKFWYLSNKHFLYQTEVSPMIITQTNHDAVPQELKDRKYDHIGDIDVLDGAIYGGIEGGDGNGYLARWSTADLTIMDYRVTEQKGIPWLAINYDTRQIWSTEWSECCVFTIYDADSLEQVDTFTLSEGNTLPAEVQGAAFFNGALYLASNIEDNVWKMNITSGDLTVVVSDIYRNHEYEMEGITFWDLKDQHFGEMHMFGNFMQAKEKAIHSYSLV